MATFTDYDMAKIKVLSAYHPYAIDVIKHVYIACENSFDKTEKALEFASSFNSIDEGIKRATCES